MNDRRPILTELEALDLVDDVINVALGKLPREDTVIVGALVIGIYQVGAGEKTMLSKAPIGAMNHWTQIGVHTQALQSLSREQQAPNE